jgi:hypothetical protein
LGIAVRPEIPRAAVASVPIVAIALISLAERPLSRAAFGKPAALPILPICKPAPVVLARAFAIVGWPLEIGLRRVRRQVRLRLKPLLRLLIGALSLRRRGETIRQRAEIAVVLHVVALAFARGPRLTALGERLRGLRRCNKAKVMLGVLQIVLRRDRVAAGVGVPRELEIFLRDMMRVAAYFDVRSIRFIGSRQRIRASPIVRGPSAHPFILTWSHFVFPTSIRLSPQLCDQFRRKLCRFWREKAHFTPPRHSNGLISSHPKHGHERPL